VILFAVRMKIIKNLAWWVIFVMAQYISVVSELFMCKGLVMMFNVGCVFEGQGSSWWFWMRRMPWLRMLRMHCVEVSLSAF